MDDLVKYLGPWLSASYRQYLIALDEHPEQRQTVTIPEDREGEGDRFVHASTLDSCPKWVALDRLKLRKKAFSFQERQNMEAGKRMAQLFVWVLPVILIASMTPSAIGMVRTPASLMLSGMTVARVYPRDS